MAKVKHYTGIDIGTEKISTVIVGVNQHDGEMRVMGVSSVPSRGIKKSQVVHLEHAIHAIEESVDSAERMAGASAREVIVSVGGVQIESQNSKGMVAVSSASEEIQQSDVARVLEAARAVSIPSTREILHVIPQEFRVDTQEGIRDPVGMSGVRLEVEAHVITGASAALKTIEKCLAEVGLRSSAFVFSGLASAHAVLTDTEKELGVACLDVGAGTCALTVYVEGALRHSAVIPVGALHITKDVTAGLQVSLDSGEKIKKGLSAEPYAEFKPLPGESREATRERRKRQDVFSTEGLDLQEPVPALSRRATIEGLIFPRLEELFDLVHKELKSKNLLEQLPAGIVLTGGGALTVGMVDMCKKCLNVPARIGKPSGLRGLMDELDHPAFATVTGLIKATLSGEDAKEVVVRSAETSSMSGFSLSALTKLPRMVLQAIRSLLP